MACCKLFLFSHLRKIGSTIRGERPKLKSSLGKNPQLVLRDLSSFKSTRSVNLLNFANIETKRYKAHS